jgi:hypothetical protein
VTAWKFLLMKVSFFLEQLVIIIASRNREKISLENAFNVGSFGVNNN